MQHVPQRQKQQSQYAAGGIQQVRREAARDTAPLALLLIGRELLVLRRDNLVLRAEENQIHGTVYEQRAKAFHRPCCRASNIRQRMQSGTVDRVLEIKAGRPDISVMLRAVFLLCQPPRFQEPIQGTSSTKVFRTLQ